MSEYQFRHDRAGYTGPLRVHIESTGSFGAAGTAGLGQGQGFADGIINLAGLLKAADGSDYLAAATPPGEGFTPPEHRLTVYRGATAISSLSFVPVETAPGVVDINTLLSQGRAVAATPEQLLSLAAVAAELEQQNGTFGQTLTAIQAALADTEQYAGGIERRDSLAEIDAAPDGLYLNTGEMGGPTYQRKNGITTRRADLDGARAAQVQAVQATADAARSAIGNSTPAQLSSRPGTAGPQFYKGRRWVWQAGGTPDGGMVLAAQGGGTWVVEAYAVDLGFYNLVEGEDNAARIQAAVNRAVALNRPLVSRAVGRYGVGQPIRVNPALLAGETAGAWAAAAAAPIMGFNLSAPLMARPYNSAGTGFVLYPLPGFPDDQTVLDLRYCKSTSLTAVAADATGFATIRGVEYGERVGYTGAYGIHSQNNCSWHGGYEGVTSRNAGLHQHVNNNVSGAGHVGVAMYEGSGDSTFIGGYVNTNNPDYAGGDLYTGAGYLLVNSGNSSVTGGKVEWNSKGVVVYNTPGITVMGVQFDLNKQSNIVGQCDSSALQSQLRSLAIIGNRFLSGGQITGEWGGRHIVVRIRGGTVSSSGTIIGNMFAKAGPGAYDAAPAETGFPVGPRLEAVLMDFAGGTAHNWQVSGVFAEASEGDVLAVYGDNYVVDARGLSTFGAIQNGGTGAIWTGRVGSAPDTAAQAAGANPTKGEYDALLAEVRNLKAQMRAAGLLA